MLDIDRVRAVSYMRVTAIVRWSATPPLNDEFGSSLPPPDHGFNFVSGISVLWKELTPTYFFGVSARIFNPIQEAHVL
jgi:hypothetical protein